ncbi:MAG: UvrB/UvrC motif-containing protein [Victivallaceae bacterium]
MESSCSSSSECSRCKKPAKVCYTCVDGELITRTYLCNECPSPQTERYGKDFSLSKLVRNAHLSIECGNCKITWQQVESNESLGCSQCYVVFKELLIPLLTKANKISRCFSSDKHSGILHIGKHPGEIREINPVLQVIALNEALKETLVKEEYEQAALIRDQIKALQKTTNDMPAYE